MKRIISAMALLLALCLLLAGCNKNSDDNTPNGYKLASSDEADYLFYVPESWIIDTSTLYTSAYVSAGDVSSISVTAYGLERESTTVADWWKGYQDQLTGTFSGYEAVSEKEITMGGVDGMQYTYTATLADVKYNFVCTAVVKANYVYYMLYTSTPTYFENHLTELDAIISYFNFK